MELEKLKVAVVHDWLVNYGGAERVVETILEIFPQADIYTLVYDEKKMGKSFPKEKVKTTFIQKIPKATKLYTKLLPLMPLAFEELDLTNYDLVISSSSCCAKGVITSPNTLHISYVHSPMRYIWDLYYDYKKKSNFLVKAFMTIFSKSLRIWDVTSSRRIDVVIANSDYIKKRIKKCWGIDSKVIYPPVEIEKYYPNGKEAEDFYVVFSRFVAYKRIDLAIEVCKELNRKLVVIGDGEERENLKRLADNNKNIIFTGRISDEEVRDYLQRCKAMIFCAEEDFGIIPVEAQACGRPVIAYGKGGALETVVNGVTGVFFDRQEKESVKKAILEFENKKFKAEDILENSRKFSKEKFKNKLIEVINEKNRIDCRMINNSGIGTYLREILPYLLETQNQFLLIGNREKLKEFLEYKNVELLECDIKIFSLEELFFFPVKPINQCDIYYSPNFNIALGIKIPIYLTIHDVIFLDMPELTSKLGYIVRKFYYKLAYKKAKKIFTVSNFSKKRIEEHLGREKKIVVTYNGVSKYILEKSDEKYIKKDYIIFVGNIKKHKGLKILLEAFKLVKKEDKKLKLVIVGNQNNFRTKDKEVIELLEDRNLNKDIIFTGYVDNKELKKLIAEARILVQPSLYEGFGIPPLEALALGTNVIVSDIEVFREVYTQMNIIFFKLNDKNDLSKKILSYNLIVENRLKNEEILEKYSYFNVSQIIQGELL